MNYRAHYDEASWSLIFSPEPSLPSGLLSSRERVFVCAALQDPARMASLVGRSPAFAPAVALGYRRALAEVEGAPRPFMLPAGDPGRILTGALFLDLGGEEVERIDGFELAGGHRRKAGVEVLVGERRLPAITYLASRRPPER